MIETIELPPDGDTRCVDCHTRMPGALNVQVRELAAVPVIVTRWLCSACGALYPNARARLDRLQAECSRARS